MGISHYHIRPSSQQKTTSPQLKTREKIQVHYCIFYPDPCIKSPLVRSKPEPPTPSPPLYKAVRAHSLRIVSIKSLRGEKRRNPTCGHSDTRTRIWSTAASPTFADLPAPPGTSGGARPVALPHRRSQIRGVLITDGAVQGIPQLPELGEVGRQDDDLTARDIDGGVEQTTGDTGDRGRERGLEEAPVGKGGEWG